MDGDMASPAALVRDRAGYKINEATGRSGQGAESRAQVKGGSR